MILSIISDEDFLKKMTRRQFSKNSFQRGKTVKKKFKKRKKVYIEILNKSLEGKTS
jgi:hypothetical protein